MSENKGNVLYLTDSSGKVSRYVQYRQYVLNQNQQFAVIAIDNEEMGGVIEIRENDSVESVFIGKLNEQNFIFRQQIINSLNRDEDPWDFEDCPNPEILLMTRK